MSTHNICCFLKTENSYLGIIIKCFSLTSLLMYPGPSCSKPVSLTNSLRVISLTVLADSIHNILKFFAEKNVSSFCKSYSHFFSKKFQHICISLYVNFNKSLTNDVFSFEQLGLGKDVPPTYRDGDILILV